jgi:hypothetical protein
VSGEGPLSAKARKLSEDNRSFQDDFTQAMRLVAGRPQEALARLEGLQPVMNRLERDEIEFLGLMGEFGAQKLPEARSNWTARRLESIIAQGRCHLLLAAYDAAQANVEAARALIEGEPDHPAAAELDELEAFILQARS